MCCSVVLGVELPDVDGVDSSPTEYTYGVSNGALSPGRNSRSICNSPKIPQRLHLKTITHRAHVPVRVADQVLDWLKDCLAVTRS